MGFTIQEPGLITFVIECDPDWTPCEKAQARAKAEKLNQHCPVTRDPGYGSAKRARGDAAAAAWRATFNALRAGNPPPQTSLLGNDPNNTPNGGTDSDFMDPCMKDELNELEPAAQQEYIANCQPDHILELQFTGGQPAGPMAFMSGRVNGSLGGQLRAAGATGPVGRFETMGC